MSPQVPTRDPGAGGGGGGPADCNDCFPAGGSPLQLLGLDTMGDRDWMTPSYSNYIFNSSGAQQGNRFNDWADLMAAIAVVGGPKTITFEQDETVPAGAYDLSNVSLRGNSAQFSIQLYFGPGATISDWTNGIITEGLQVVSTSPTPVFSIGAGEFYTLILENAAAISSTTAPFVKFEDNANGFVIGLLGGAGIWNAGVGADGGSPVVETNSVGGSFFGVAYAGTAATVEDDTIVGDGLFVRLIQDVGASTDLGLVQTGFTGFMVDQIFTSAKNLGFDPSGSGGVLTSTNVYDALNELAGLV